MARRIITPCPNWVAAFTIDQRAHDGCDPGQASRRPQRLFGGIAISTNFRHNEQIRISPIFLINDKDEKVGSISTSEALRLAREAGLDLVEVAPTARPPVCKIMDYGKWRYQQQKKEDKSRASARGGQLKELKLRTVRIGDHDLLIKIQH